MNCILAWEIIIIIDLRSVFIWLTGKNRVCFLWTDFSSISELVNHRRELFAIGIDMSWFSPGNIYHTSTRQSGDILKQDRSLERLSMIVFRLNRNSAHRIFLAANLLSTGIVRKPVIEYWSNSSSHSLSIPFPSTTPESEE